MLLLNFNPVSFTVVKVPEFVILAPMATLFPSDVNTLFSTVKLIGPTSIAVPLRTTAPTQNGELVDVVKLLITLFLIYLCCSFTVTILIEICFTIHN